MLRRDVKQTHITRIVTGISSINPARASHLPVNEANGSQRRIKTRCEPDPALFRIVFSHV